MNMPIDRRITLDGFLQAFRRQDRNQPDHPFCFILGAGASKPSGIRTGGELARHFVEEMHQAENFANESLEGWCAADRLGIKDFRLDRVAEFYPELYQRMFGEHPDHGYAFLEKEMEDREPSYGYSVLAWILAKTPHKVVITPNFDNLVADALSIHSATFPRVVGHDSLAGFVQAALRRPLIAKVHGDLGFTPRNTPKEIARLSDEWKTALTRVLERFTPIVIGYGGNDGSLMAALEGLPKNMPDSIYWCQREGNPVSQRVTQLLEERKGRLVVVPGFDELMLKLQDVMREEWKMPDLLGEMKKRQREREESYDKQRGEIGARLAAPPDTTRAAANLTGVDDARLEARDLAGAAVRVLASTQAEKPWWQWYQEATEEADIDRRDAVFCAGLEALPNSAELLGHYASFLRNVRKDLDRAEQFYEQAIEADPTDAINLGNYALFLHNERKDLGRAEQFFERAIEADPTYANNLGNYAIFLQNGRKDLGSAKGFYERAIEGDPKNANFLGNYAGLLLSLNSQPEGFEMLKRAETALGFESDLPLELAFYRLAHDGTAWPKQMEKLRSLLQTGARSRGWAFDANIEQAEKENHPNPALLRALAKVINDQAPLDSLNLFPEWRAAQIPSQTRSPE